MSKKRNKNSRKKKLKSRSSPGANAHHLNHTQELDYIITEEPLVTDNMRALPDEVQEQIHELCDRVRITPHDTIKELMTLIKRYPHIPSLYNFLYTAYANSHQHDKADKIRKGAYELFPDYLFSKMDYADHLVRHGELKKAADVYGNKFELTSLYPDRIIFHKTEVICFHGVTGYYHAMVGQYRNAIHCMDVLDAVSPLHGFTTRLLQKLDSLSKFATC
jgi:predicted Zn-dependent protease